MIRQSDADCRCQSLREQLASLERRYEALAQQHEELLAQKDKDSLHDGANPRALDGLALANSSSHHHDTMGTSESVVPQSRDLRRNANCSYSGRILRPTFSKSTNIEGMNMSTLSCAWNLWGDDSMPTEQPISLSLLNDAAYVELVNIFFERRWPYLPVLHRPTFESKYLTPFMTNLEVDPVSNFFVYMVLALRRRRSLGSSKKIGLFIGNSSVGPCWSCITLCASMILNARNACCFFACMATMSHRQ